MNYLVQKLAFPAPNPSYDKDLFKPQNLLTIPIEIGTIRREIPILCYKQREKCENWIIYFHGNAEDLYQAAQFVTELMLGLKVNAIAVEYPGYGIYPNQQNKDKDEIIEEDAIIVYNYVQQNLKVNPQNIYIIGRSIGTGPAFYTASTKECGGLIAISPYRSVNQSRGTWIDYIGAMSKSVFNNLQRSEKVKSKCLIIHGVNDQVIPIQNSKDIVNRMKSLNMLVVFKEIKYKEHNNLDVEYDIMENIRKEFELLKNLEFIQ